MHKTARRFIPAMIVTALLSAGWWAPPAVAGPVVSDLPTLSLTLNAGAFAAVNADVNHETTASINVVEVTDPGNPKNNLVVSDGLTELKGRGNYTWTLPSKKKPY